MNNRTIASHFAWLLPALSLFSATAFADVLVLKNGDRITGDIKRIWDAEITIEPEYSDEFDVEVSAVAHIESARELEIVLDDGSTMNAKFSGADAQGKQTVHAASGTVSVPLAQLFEVNEPEEAFEWDSNVEVSANVSKGNTDSVTAKVRADTTVKINDHRHIGEITFDRERLTQIATGEQISTKEQDLFKYSYNWLFSDAWFFSADLTFERDPIILLDSRVITSAGLGRDIWDTPRRTLNVILGAGRQFEKIDSASTDSGVVTWSLRFRQDFFSEDVELFHNQDITTNVTGRTNTSYKTSTGLGYELTDLLSARMTLDYDYETRPVESAANEDITFLLGINAEF